MLRLWLLKVAPFLSRWSEAAPAACCGVCGTCLTATATGLTIEVLGAKTGSGRDGVPAEAPDRQPPA